MNLLVIANKGDGGAEYLYSLCENPIVKKTYEKYSEELKSTWFKTDNIKSSRRFYVYAWYSKTEPKKYFYIGKGTASRYKHILKDIQDYYDGRYTFSSPSYHRCRRYALIAEWYGIESEYLLTELNEAEALLYEKMMKIEYSNNGHCILDYEDTGTIISPEEYEERNITIDESYLIPNIEDSYFHKVFDPNYIKPYFDEITEEDILSIYIHDGNGLIEQKQIELREYFSDIIKQWVTENKGKVYKTVSKKTRSIVVTNDYAYEQFAKYHYQGKKYFNLYDVLDYINNKQAF